MSGEDQRRHRETIAAGGMRTRVPGVGPALLRAAETGEAVPATPEAVAALPRVEALVARRHLAGELAGLLRRRTA